MLKSYGPNCFCLLAPQGHRSNVLNSSATALSSAGCEAPSLASNSTRWEGAFQTPGDTLQKDCESLRFKEIN